MPAAPQHRLVIAPAACDCAGISEGAVVDRQFGTIDALIILPAEHFGAPDDPVSSIA